MLNIIPFAISGLNQDALKETSLLNDVLAGRMT